MGSLSGFLSRTWIQWLLAAVIFFAASLFYMGGALTNCSSSSTALFSDSSGGLAWTQWANGNRLSWGYTHETNYPIGESTNKPQDIASQAIYVPYRFFSWLTTPTCGLNLIVLLGFMSCGLAMFGLVRWLFKKTSIALYAGYAAAFVPYHLLKAEAHVTYVNSAVFIGIVWAYLWFISRPSYLRISLISVLTALAWYMDGYFILLAAALSAALLALVLFKDLPWQKGFQRQIAAIGRKILANFKKYWKYYLWFSVLLFLLSLPILSYDLSNGGEIHKSLNEARGEIRYQAKVYSARPAEYLLPSYNNAFVPDSYKRWRLIHQHGSNPTEDTLYVGLSVAVLAAAAVVLAFRKEKRGIELRPNIRYFYVVALSSALVIILALLSLPPTVTILGHDINTPTNYIVDLTSFWRVFARFFLVIDPLVILLASAGLFAISNKWPAWKRTVLVLFFGAILFLEYLPAPRQHVNNLYKSSPALYQMMSTDKSIKAVADYPLDNLAYSPLTFTFQQVYQRPLIDPNSLDIVDGPFIQSITGLRDPQTLCTLKAEGANLLVSAGNDLSDMGLKQYLPPDGSGASLGVPTLYSYRLDSAAACPDVLAPSSGFDKSVVDSKLISHHVIHSVGALAVLSTKNRQEPSGRYQVGFDVVSLSGRSERLSLSQNGSVIWQGIVPINPIHISETVSGQGDIKLKTSATLDITNLSAAPQ